MSIGAYELDRLQAGTMIEKGFDEVGKVLVIICPFTEERSRKSLSCFTEDTIS
jgi:hypothetical protein